MKILNIEKVGKNPVYDISVDEVQHYVLKNGVVTHNTGIMLSSDNVWIVGRSQDKDGSELAGYNFTVRVEKSRYVREKSAIPITVKFEGGMSKWTGLLDIALEAKAVVKPSNGWFSRVNDDGEIEDKKFRRDATDSVDFWTPVLKTSLFNDYINVHYKVTNGSLLDDATIDEELESL